MAIAQEKKTHGLILGVALFLLQSLFTAQANTTVLTNATLQQMTQEEKQAFNIQYQMEYKQHNDSYLALVGMRNPYSKLIDAYENATNLNNKKIINLSAKRDRFDECKGIIGGFIGFANGAKRLTEGPLGTLTKDEYMKSSAKHHEISYPFTAKERNESHGRFWQVFMETGWKYRGKGEESVFVFFNTCMNIPIALFEAEYTDDSDEN